MADWKTFKLEIITPDRVFFSDEAYMLEITTAEGELGIYAGHIPLTVVLEPGVCKIHMVSQEKKAAIHSGFMEILPNKITIMAEIAEWPEEIDLNRAEEARIRAERHLKENGADMTRAEYALRRSIARIEALK